MASLNPTNEPVAWSGAATGLVVAGIPLLRAFGVNITVDQSDAILGFLGAAIAFGGLALRMLVVTTGKAESAVQTALTTAPSSDPNVSTAQQSQDILATAKS